MGFRRKRLLRDLDKVPIPQYFNEDTDEFEPLLGRDGAMLGGGGGEGARESALVGYSSDIKPDASRNKGRGYLELDTKNIYISDGAQWVLFG